MEIQRNLYLNKLINRKHNGMIKVITGIRRCGKSFLLFELFRKHLLYSGVSQDHIITLALDERGNEKFHQPDTMYSYLKNSIKDAQRYYILLDEIQLLDQFESVLNGLLRVPNADIYVTGSNSKFLSSDVITEFRGRGDEVHVYPLSFAEFSSAFEGTPEQAWESYCLYGGLPLTVSMVTEEQKITYLTNQFQNVYIRDIIERNHIRHEEELDELLNFLSSSVGSYTNPLKLSQTFQSVKKKTITSTTLVKYLQYLQEAFLISKALRYDVKGKRYIGTPCKYYFEDIGLRNARIGFRQLDPGHVMENIIYNELKIRGFNVDIGSVEIYDKTTKGRYTRKQLEVDFVANLGSKRYYIQSAFAMPTAEKIYQEERPFLHIDDSFKKILLVADPIRSVRRTEQGIVIMGVREFLLNGHSLEL